VSRPYRLSPEARRQIDEIGAFVAEDSVDAALKIYEAFEDAFQLLAGNPGIGHTREDLTTRPVKFWTVLSYLVIYDPESSPLQIITVVHSETSHTCSRKIASPLPSMTQRSTNTSRKASREEGLSLAVGAGSGKTSVALGMRLEG
jgi:toxin ParE1/3/4